MAIGPQKWRLLTSREDVKGSACNLPPHQRLVQFNSAGVSTYIDEATALHAWDIDGFEVHESPGDVHLQMIQAQTKPDEDDEDTDDKIEDAENASGDPDKDDKTLPVRKPKQSAKAK